MARREFEGRQAGGSPVGHPLVELFSLLIFILALHVSTLDQTALWVIVTASVPVPATHSQFLCPEAVTVHCLRAS